MRDTFSVTGCHRIMLNQTPHYNEHGRPNKSPPTSK
jgi:hypothetical protein